MKFKIYILTLSLFLTHCYSLREEENKKTKTEIKKPTNQTNLKQKIKRTKNKPIKKSIKNKAVKKPIKKRLLAKNNTPKQALLPKNYGIAQKSKKALEIEFENHLMNISKTCEIQKDKKEFLYKQVNLFDDFLLNSLKDPYMDYNLKLLFADITSLLEEINYKQSIDLDRFNLVYRTLYNLSNNIEIKNYPDNWAKAIAKGIKCIKY